MKSLARIRTWAAAGAVLLLLASCAHRDVAQAVLLEADRALGGTKLKTVRFAGSGTGSIPLNLASISEISNRMRDDWNRRATDPPFVARLGDGFPASASLSIEKALPVRCQQPAAKACPTWC